MYTLMHCRQEKEKNEEKREVNESQKKVLFLPGFQAKSRWEVNQHHDGYERIVFH